MNWILRYWEEIESGNIIVSNKVHKIYKRLANDIKNPKGDWIFDGERAERPIQFIETFCRQSKGEWIGKPVQLQLFQKAYISALFGFVHKETGIRRFKETLFLVARKNGKSTMLSGIALYMLVADGEGGAEVYSVAPLALDTLVSTAEGWKKLGEIKVGDKVFNEKGEQATVTYLSPIVKRKTYKLIFDDGSEIIATDNHLWTVEERYTPHKGASQEYRVVTIQTEKIAKKLYYGGRPRYRIKVAEPLQYSEKELPIDPYVLGVWLGDGRSNRGAIVGENGDIEYYLKEFENRGYTFSQHYSEKANLTHGTILGIRTQLRQIGLLDNKYIPDIYKRASVSQRMDLLRGLMDTDGTVTKSGECRFSSVNKRLAEDVYELVLSLGLKAHLRSAPTTDEGTVWIVSFKAYGDNYVFNLPRKRERQRPRQNYKTMYRWIVDIQEVEPVPARCIEVNSPSHLFLVGKTLIATHNTKKDQARIVFTEAVNMVRQSPALSKHIHKRKSDMYMPLTFSKMEPLASDSNSLDGLNSHCVIIDELHAIKDRNLYEVMKQSMSARRQPLLVMITTAGTVRECIYDDMYDYACKVVDGVIEDDRFLPVLYELDSRDEWTDWRMWQKANPGLGTIKKVEDLTEKVERAKANPKDLPGVLCKDFNIRDTVAGMWLTFEDINNEETFDIEEFKDCYAVGGADLSSTTDLTSATLIFMKPGSNKKYVLQQYFLPEDLLEKRVVEDKIPYDKWQDRGLLTTTPGNKVDYHVVTEWFVKMFREYGIRPLWVGYDPWNSQYWVKEMQEFGFEMIEVRQGYKTLSQPMKELEADLKAKLINYNNNSILKWNLTNVSVKMDENGNIRPAKGLNQRARIDGAVSLLIAYVILQQKYNDYIALL